ncbi:MAG: IS110 family transposase [Planctomycetaceae bacterium]|jgi:transposase|nr:IS110 family transposase [Planctomycetaceae bacterium]
MDTLTQYQDSVFGIDVSKETLDVYHLPSMEYKKVKNNEKGLRELIAWSNKHNPKIVACEYSGGYERKLVVALVNANIPVVAVNPAHVRYYAKSRGIMCKTDKVDAKTLAEFTRERQPRPSRHPSEHEVALKEFVTFRRQLIKERTALKNRLEHATQNETVKITNDLIELINRRIKKIEKAISKLIQENSEWKKRNEILNSVPGIGVDTARTLQADLPELGEGSVERISALAGLAPMNRESGKWKGKRCIQGGRATVRAALHNAAMAAIFFTKNDNVFKQMYHHLTKNLCKTHNVALVAVSHKMLKIVHTLIKNNLKWENKLNKNIT